jgi:hypothetical protein
MQGLIIRSPWIDKIIAGEKTWEMRTRPTAYRGRVGLIRKGTGHIVGVADIVDSLDALDEAQLAANRDRHGIPADMDGEVLRARWVYPWVLRNVRALPTPVPVGKTAGPVIWMKLAPQVVAAVDAHGADTTTRVVTAMPAPPPPRAQSVVIEITDGAIRNANICVRPALEWLPDDVIGGSSKQAAARSRLTVVLVPGETVETDIAGDKMLLRCRGAVRDFFDRSGARPNDRIRLSMHGPRTLRVELAR